MNPLTAYNDKPDEERRWKRLLADPKADAGELYDGDNGIKQEILLSLGFHDQYLSYASNTRTRNAKRHKAKGHNWVSADKVWKGIQYLSEARVLHWSFCFFYNQARSKLSPAARRSIQCTVSDAFRTHARGIFIDKDRGVAVIYEPQAYANQVKTSFGPAIDRLLRHYTSLDHYVIYSDQSKSNDCEKRVLRFGTCCWLKFQADHELGACTCGLSISHISKYYPRT